MKFKDARSTETLTGDVADGMVWYAAYGSNLCRERFLTYIRGGRYAGKPSDEREPGCPDGHRDPPQGEAPILIPHRLYFAGDAPGWGGGGVAFVDTARDDAARTYGRMFRVTRRQFEEVLRQENDYAERVTVTLERLTAPGDRLDVGPDGRYRRVLYLGQRDGVPVVTFTASLSGPSGSTAVPSLAYLRTIVRGLAETYADLTADEATAYLAHALGPLRVPDQLATLVSQTLGVTRHR